MEIKKGLTSFHLHILAMIFMFIDHIEGSILPESDVLTGFGRLAFPIFAFMIAEGFYHTKDIKKYLLRMFIFALISEIPYNLFKSGNLFCIEYQNVLITFVLSILTLLVFKRLKQEPLFFKVMIYPMILFMAFVIATVISCDYYGCGILMVLVFYFTRVDETISKSKKILICLIQFILMFIINGILFSPNIDTMELGIQTFAIFALPIIWLYNGELGFHNKFTKYLNYWFYPIHVLMIYIIKYLIC